ncbi:uncharacterized protein B0I36DRAFT_329822 [Microdochium trichocladiopsis]|uniref:rRNA methyltransferase 1, mitochondrial n=1 Tax=Microdochium trichocladiopsis TaxID=1682393 RepID=A0A9P8XZP6_9PEZI|nr:uncharacterized protein B0I36DRAFT_329822 [Microdochium trichocladiopsis]KAH7026073.1 hypothetical protein B0I36DRAFT_329822 [Microdochium trichocladiopsis]
MRLPIPSACLSAGQQLMMRNLALRTRALPSTTTFRSSSLSAIHRGLRDSEKARPQGFQLKALEAASNGSKNGRRTTSRQRRDPGWKAPTYKIKKGKKDITDKGPQPKSRRSRFNDPTETFGKKSQVWQIKHGNLRSEMEKLTRADAEGDSRNSRFNDRRRESGDSRRGRSDPDRAIGRQSFDRTSRFSERRGQDRFEPRQDRDFGARPQRQTDGRRPPRSFERDASRTESREGPPRSSSFVPRETGHRHAGDEKASNPRDEQAPQPTVSRVSPRDEGPIRIHHTTAASQFLYGRSVVESALKHSRRQLYRFYVYSGEDRQSLTQDEYLLGLAKSRKVECIPVRDQQGLRMLDKMSGGRPHNGCILEASPLPQIPVKGLGVESEEATKPGFHLELAHQSAEEAQVNGTSTFVAHDLPAGRHPLVLLLDGILDPGNLGAILRSAAFLGVSAVAITKDSSAGLTPVALKASAGAAEVMTLFSVKSTLGFLEQSKDAGWMVYAAVPSTSRMRNNSHLSIDRVESYDPLSSQPTILVIGSEGEGLAKQVRRISDHEVSIPSASGLFEVVDSLNASVATALLCQSFLKKQTSDVLRSQGFVEREQDEEAMF